MEYPCKACGKYGLLLRDHRPDGTLPQGSKSVHRSDTSKVKPNTEYRAERRKTISFNFSKAMQNIETKSTKTKKAIDEILQLLVDYGAIYSAIGELELTVMMKEHNIICTNIKSSIPSGLKGNRYLQYGNGSHGSPPRKIIGSVDIQALSDSSVTIIIIHIILQGPSLWVIGKNVTCHVNIEHINRKVLVFQGHHGEDSISIIDLEFLSFTPMKKIPLHRN